MALALALAVFFTTFTTAPRWEFTLSEIRMHFYDLYNSFLVPQCCTLQLRLFPQLSCRLDLQLSWPFLVKLHHDHILLIPLQATPIQLRSRLRQCQRLPPILTDSLSNWTDKLLAPRHGLPFLHHTVVQLAAALHNFECGDFFVGVFFGGGGVEEAGREVKEEKLGWEKDYGGVAGEGKPVGGGVVLGVHGFDLVGGGGNGRIGGFLQVDVVEVHLGGEAFGDVAVREEVLV